MRAKKMGRSVPDYNPEPIAMRPTRTQSNLVLYVILVIVFIILGSMGVSGFKDDSLALQERQYCSLVALHRDNPDIGWPDYEHRFDRDCNADGTVKVEP